MSITEKEEKNMEDSTNYPSEYLLQKDLKDHLLTQEKWDSYSLKIVTSKRKITEQTWKKIVLVEAKKHDIDLKISRNNTDDSIYSLLNNDPYSVEGACNASS